MRRMQGPLFRSACTEGNYGLANILRGARVEDAKAEAAAKANRTSQFMMSGPPSRLRRFGATTFVEPADRSSRGDSQA